MSVTVLPRRELLTSCELDGVRHAHYPSAEATLCLQLIACGRRHSPAPVPTCEECVRVAVLWHAIDRCVPGRWRLVPRRTLRRPSGPVTVHGRWGYKNGCRCDVCREAESAYYKARYARKKAREAAA